MNTQAVQDNTTDTDSGIALTDAAANRIRELLLEEGNLQLKLRVYITGGGCSGFQYGFSFEKTMNPDDLLVEKEVDGPSGKVVVGVVVDPLSMTYLEGAKVDYKESLQGAFFSVINPNAQTTCGCGSSFSI